MTNQEANKDEDILKQALAEIDSIQKNKIQKNMLGQLLNGSEPIDKEIVLQMHG
jgi:hypothetical protein